MQWCLTLAHDLGTAQNQWKMRGSDASFHPLNAYHWEGAEALLACSRACALSSRALSLSLFCLLTEREKHRLVLPPGPKGSLPIWVTQSPIISGERGGVGEGHHCLLLVKHFFTSSCTARPHQDEGLNGTVGNCLESGSRVTVVV